MDDVPPDAANPYQSPREHGYLTPEYLAWWAWLKDRTALLGCGCLTFIGLFCTWIAYVVMASWFGWLN